MILSEKADYGESRFPGMRYLRAKAELMLGRRERAAELLRQSAAAAAHGKVYRLLSQLELPGEDYLAVLARMHAHLRPATYLEVGVARGRSLQLVRPDTDAIGIDPMPALKAPPGPRQRIVAETSDDFFAAHDVVAELGGRRVDFAFVDGMHRFEFALRDVLNIERVARRDSVIAVHDCLPLDARTATPERATSFWSGDVWRLVMVLKRHRPDLVVRTIATPPTGLAVILNLDPDSTALREKLPEVIAEFSRLEFASIARDKRAALNVVANDWDDVRALLDSRPAPAGVRAA